MPPNPVPAPDPDDPPSAARRKPMPHRSPLMDASLRSRALNALRPQLDRIVGILVAWGFGRDPKPARLRKQAVVLRNRAFMGLKDALAKWREKGNFERFVLHRAISAAIGQEAWRLRISVEPILRHVLDTSEHLAAFKARLELRLAEAVDIVCFAAAVRWLKMAPAIGGRNPVTWENTIAATAADVLHMFWEQLPENWRDWNLAPPSKEALRIRCQMMASAVGKGSSKEFVNELFAIGTNAAFDSASSYDPARAGRHRYDMQVAESAIRTYLDSKRGGISLAIWPPITEAIEKLTERYGRSPSVREVMEELDPVWADGLKKEPRYSYSLVEWVILNPNPNGEAMTPRDAPPALKSLIRDLVRVAGLTDAELETVRLFLEGRKHEDIASKRGVTPCHSRHVLAAAYAKMGAVATHLTRWEGELLRLRLTTGTSDFEIAKALKVRESEVGELLEATRERIGLLPDLLRHLTVSEARAFRLALHGRSPAEIARIMNLRVAEVAELLPAAIGKIPRLKHDPAEPAIESPL